MSIKYASLLLAYETFRGKRVSSVELQALWPEVYDSAARPAGHNCHSTFLMRVLEELSLSGPIEGEGRAGRPFYVTVNT